MNTIPFCHILITFSDEDEVPCQPHRAQSIPYTTCDTQYIVGLGPRTSVSRELVLQLDVL